MSRKTWKDLAPGTTAKPAQDRQAAHIEAERPSVEKLVAANPRVSALLEEQKRLAENMKRLTGGALNSETDPRYPVTALDDRRKEIEDWASKKQANFQKYKDALPASIKQPLMRKKPETKPPLLKKTLAKNTAAGDSFNRPEKKLGFLPNRPQSEKWEERRDRINAAARQAESASKKISSGLIKFDDKLGSIGRQLSELREKTGGELPPELASLDENLKKAREKSAALKALTRTDALKKKAKGNRTLQRWSEKRDKAQMAIRSASAVRSSLSSVGSKFNRPAKDTAKDGPKDKPKERSKTRSKSDDGTTDLDRRRKQSAQKRKSKKAEQDRMDRRNERAKSRRKEKKANRYA